MNAAQKILVRVYGGGDFAYVTTKREARRVGDTLFTFLFIELSDDEDCLTLEEASCRLVTACDDIDVVLDAIIREG